MIYNDNVSRIHGVRRKSEIDLRPCMELGTPESLVAEPRAKVHHKHAQEDVLKSFTTKKGKALVKVASLSYCLRVLVLESVQHNIRKHHNASGTATVYSIQYIVSSKNETVNL